MASRLPRVSSVDVSAPGPARRHRARRAGVLADGALRPLPAVGRRRRGVVLADVDLDGARLLDALPPPYTYRFVPAGHPAPWVDYAARKTYDAAYEGTGNWPFNTAYAAPLAGDAFVTRLRSLREAETFVAAGIPLVASVSWGAGRADRRPRLVVQRPPRGDRRLHRLGRPGRQRPRRQDRRRCPPRLRPRRVRERLAAEVRRRGLRHPRRRPPAAGRARPGQLVARPPSATSYVPVARATTSYDVPTPGHAKGERKPLATINV